MERQNFDARLFEAAFALIAERGWKHLSLADAARRAELPLGEVRARCPNRLALLLRFGRHADREAVTGALTDGPMRDRIFDVVMRRIDTLQAHRAGMLALLRALPSDPLTALALAPVSALSMSWLLQAVGADTSGLRGALRVQGLQLVWLAAVQAWRGDESEDLSATMAVLDQALNRAVQAENTLADMFGQADVTATASADEPAAEAPSADA